MHELHEPVLGWYDEHARDLPWREPWASPWAVMVSEFMLQQTPVARVLPVYETWLERWPTPADLAAEPITLQTHALRVVERKGIGIAHIGFADARKEQSQ